MTMLSTTALRTVSFIVHLNDDTWVTLWYQCFNDNCRRKLKATK
ncbi:hypothetical protein DMZ48_14750 [Robertkochia solimangrovi]|nr:hypothetical protein DMZ48_14750 [Robertkochia solimangrovi]